MNKVLIITYYWPPSGGAGVQRWLKFSKYLPGSGWEPHILTVDPVYAVYPAIDLSMGKDIPENIKIFRTKAINWFRFYGTDKSKIPSAGFARNPGNSISGKVSRFIRGNFFIPDPRRGWNRFAFKKACEIIEKENIKHIITTSPPHSTQLIGLKLKKMFPELRWISDLRDPWTDIYYYNQFYPTWLSKRIDKSYERRVLRRSDCIITVSKTLKSSFSLKISGIENKINVITNGFDEADYEGIEIKLPDKLTIAYVGTLSQSYPVGGLIAALKKLIDEKVDFFIRFAGDFPEELKQLISKEIPSSYVEFNPYLSHGKAVRLMMSSTVLILIIPDHRSNKGILTGKLFEYLAAGRPVLCLGPVDGDAAEIISATGAGITTDYNNIDEISEFLRKTNSYSKGPDKDRVSEYSRANNVKKIIPLLHG